MNVMKVYDLNWGFYVSPEIGMTMYFTPQKQIGLHVAAYYNSVSYTHLMGVLAALFIWKFVPETKGRTLEQMEQYWK